MGVQRFDLCVIGAGSGGLSVAAGAARLGARVVLIEGGEMGGDCLNAGCVPSKALLAAAKAVQARRSGARFGLTVDEPTLDFAATMAHVRAAIAEIAPHDSQERFEGLGVTVIREWARFVSSREVAAGPHRIRARRFVIATGALAVIPPVPGIEAVPVLTNDTVFSLTARPDHLIVVGGGPIGVELSQGFRRLGSAVTLIEAARLLGREDVEVATLMRDALLAEGVALHEGKALARLRPVDGIVEAVLSDGATVSGSHLLLATGRAPALERLDLAVAGVAFTAQGVTVDASLRSVTNRRVFAIGDVAGGGQFTHLASAHAGTVIRRAVLGLPTRSDTRLSPRVTYSDPEIAQIGLTEAEARAGAEADRVTVLHEPMADNDRAICEDRREGFVKLVLVGKRLAGVTIVAPGAGEMIGLWSLVMSRRLPLSSVAQLILPYPTRSEAAKRVAGAYFSSLLFDSPALKRWVSLVQRFIP